MTNKTTNPDTRLMLGETNKSAQPPNTSPKDTIMKNLTHKVFDFHHKANGLAHTRVGQRPTSAADNVCRLKAYHPSGDARPTALISMCAPFRRALPYASMCKAFSLDAQPMLKHTLACALCAVLPLFAQEDSPRPPDGGEGEAAAASILPEEEEGGFWKDFAFDLSAEFATRQLTYGLVDNRDPVFLFDAAIAWRDFTFTTEVIHDTTSRDDRHGGLYSSTLRCHEVSFSPGYYHTFDSLLPTPIEIGMDYVYEYHPRVLSRGDPKTPDTQFLNAGVRLPEVFLSPGITTELDIDNECGALYFRLEGEYTLELTDTLALEFGIGLGIGNPRRNRFDADVNRWGVKDLGVSLAIPWKPLSWLTVSPYVAAYEQLDPALRDAARHYIEGETHHSTQVIGGLTVTASF